VFLIMEDVVVSSRQCSSSFYDAWNYLQFMYANT
jgi:hypothetical protein